MTGSLSAIEGKVAERKEFSIPLLSGLLSRFLPPRMLAILNSPKFHLAFLFVLYGVILNRIFAHERSIVGHIGFAMDDAWIHAAVARNFIDGLGFGIVPHRPLAVSTSPTWTLLLSFFYLFFDNPVHGTMSFSILCMLGTVACLYAVVRAFTGKGWLAVFGTVLFLMNPIVLWGMGSGMELPLALFGLSFVLYLYYCFDPESRVRQWAVPPALAFAAMTRPELFLLIPLALLDTLLTLKARSSPASWSVPLRKVVLQGILIGAVLSPYFIFNLRYGGHLFPTTYYAKTLVRGVGLSSALESGEWRNIRHALVENPRSQVLDIVSTLIEHNIVLFFLIFPGMMYFMRPLSNSATSRGWLLAVAILVLPWLMGISSPAKYLSKHADRYFVILPPLAALLGMCGLNFLVEFGKLRWLPAIFVLFMALAPWRTTFGAVNHLAVDVDSTDRLYREMGLWMKANIPETAILATNDIGGLAYFARRDFIDVMGLSSPEIWPAIKRGYGEKQDMDKMIAFLRAQKVEYVLLSPRYYPNLTTRKEVFEPIMQWAERYQHGRTISPQILYKFH